MINSAVVALVCAFVLAGPAKSWAAEASPPAAAEPADRAGTETKAVQAFGNDNKTCAEWTDGCVVCFRGKSEIPACSTPGIACQPTPIICKDKPAAAITPAK